MTFGNGAQGALGHRSFDDVEHPKIVEALLGFEVKKVVCGGNHVLAVTTDDEIYSWGNNDYGQLGHGNTLTSNYPQQVVGLSTQDRISNVFCGPDSSLFASSDGMTFACGSNRFAKMSLDALATSQTSPDEAKVLAPARISCRSLQGQLIRHAALGPTHSLLVTSSGAMLAAGSNSDGQLGLNPAEFPVSRQFTLVDTASDIKVVCVAVGDNYSIAADENGSVYSFGSSLQGRRNGTQDLWRPCVVDIRELVDGPATSGSRRSAPVAQRTHLIDSIASKAGTTMILLKW